MDWSRGVGQRQEFRVRTGAERFPVQSAFSFPIRHLAYKLRWMSALALYASVQARWMAKSSIAFAEVLQCRRGHLGDTRRPTENPYIRRHARLRRTDPSESNAGTRMGTRPAWVHACRHDRAPEPRLPVSPPSRLCSLLTDKLRWRVSTGLLRLRLHRRYDVPPSPPCSGRLHAGVY